MATRRFVAYERVSTKRQGASGLGLEAQWKAIDDFVASRGAEVLARFTEVESGELADRPGLGKALRLNVPRCRALGGSSAINGMVYIRGLPSDFDGWAAKGYTGWGFQDVLPYLRKSERNQPGRMQGEVSRSRSIAANLA